MAQTATAPLDINKREGEIVLIPVAAGIQLFPGELITVNAAGFATFAQDAASTKVVGRCEVYVDNRSDSTGGALSVTVRRGVFAYKNSSTHAFAVGSEIGVWAYVQDDQTVATSSTNSIKAGVFLGVDPITGMVWVDTRPALYS